MQTNPSTSNVDIHQVFNDVKGGIDRARNLYLNGEFTDCVRVLRGINKEMWGLDALVRVEKRTQTSTGKRGQQQQQQTQRGGGKKRGYHQLFSIDEITEALTDKAA